MGKNDIAVYKNQLNTVPLRDFTPIEIDLLFVILSKMRDQGTSSLTFHYNDLRALSNYKSTSLERFTADLERVFDKIIHLDIKMGTDRKFVKFVLFTKYEVDLDEQTLTISANPDFAYIINNISGDFTKLEIQELTNLSSSYSKNLYRLLKQYRATGFVVFDIDTFRYLMCIPDSYRMGNIDQRVLKPALGELSPYFFNLRVVKKRGKGKQSRSISRIEFHFTPQDDVKEGKRTFKDANGNYYNKPIDELTGDEIDKAFPDPHRRPQKKDPDGFTYDYDAYDYANK